MKNKDKLDIYQKLTELDLLLENRYVTTDKAQKDYMILMAGKMVVEIMEDILNVN